jgi:tetratricopeptide (TPR) repeat protein
LLLDEGRQKTFPASFTADACYIVALALTKESHHSGQTAGVNDRPEDTAVSFMPLALPFSFYLDEAALTQKQAEAGQAGVKSAAPAAKTGDVLPLPRQNAPLISLQRGGPALEILKELAGQAGFKLTSSKAVQEMLAERMFSIAFKDRAALEMLEQAADYFHLGIVADKNVAHLAHPEELEAKAFRDYAQALTRHALVSALTVDEMHPWAPVACLELGNADAAAAKYADAAEWYQYLIHARRETPCLGAAYYNLAIVQTRKGDFAGARKTLFRVIDNSPGHELAVGARLRLGKLYLVDESVDKAITILRHAQPLALQSEYHPLVALTLATAYLKKGQPDKARLVLAKERIVLQREKYRPSAIFLDSLAHYQTAKAAGAGRREASALLESLLREKEFGALTPVGAYLLAQAYRDLGLLEQAERHLRPGPPDVTGALRTSMDYLLADTLLKENREQEAIAMFEKLAAADSTYRNQARLRLARLDVEHKHFAEALRKCGELWSERAFSDTSELLHLWGTALEGMGDLTRAAQCFAGKAPESKVP